MGINIEVVKRFIIRCNGCDSVIAKDLTDEIFINLLGECAIYCRDCRIAGRNPSNTPQAISVGHGAPDDDSQYARLPADKPAEKPAEQTPKVTESLPLQEGDTLKVDEVHEEPAKHSPKVVKTLGGKVADIKSAREAAAKQNESAPETTQN